MSLGGGRAPWIKRRGSGRPSTTSSAPAARSASAVRRAAEARLRSHAWPAALVAALARLADGGHQAFLVGGSVRDVLLGRSTGAARKGPERWDVATDRRPEDVRASAVALRYGDASKGDDTGTSARIKTYDDAIPAVVKARADAGKHILVEKPPAATMMRPRGVRRTAKSPRLPPTTRMVFFFGSRLK